MKVMRLALALPLLLPAFAPLYAQEVAPAASVGEPAASHWVTLGTRGGPVASGTRSQPANLLVNGNHIYLVDVGDGTAGQLAKVGITANRVEAVFISHLHFDHTAGLSGLLGLRWQTNAPNVLTIYGPPGTTALVDGLIASMEPGTTAGYGVPGAPQVDTREQVRVIELRDGSGQSLDGMQVLARKNSHYSFVAGSELERNFESLSFRFELPDRTIAFTGDTGPSAAVEELARGADLLIAEMMDVDYTIAAVRRSSPGLDPRAVTAMERHLTDHHLLPEDVGKLAQRASVGAVVVTHFVGKEPDEPGHLDYLKQIAEHYSGPVVVADDLNAF